MKEYEYTSDVIKRGDLKEIKRRIRHNGMKFDDYFYVSLAADYGHHQMMMFFYGRIPESDIEPSQLKSSIKRAVDDEYWLIVKFLAGKLVKMEERIK